MGFADREPASGLGLGINGQSKGEHNKIERQTLDRGSKKMRESHLFAERKSAAQKRKLLAQFFNNKQPISVGV